MKMSDKLVQLDEPTFEINVHGGKIARVKQDRLGRVYIWVKPKEEALKSNLEAPQDGVSGQARYSLKRVCGGCNI